MIAATLALLLFAQDATTTAPPPAPSALVQAAAKAKEKRATTKRKVITNADVKKSKGKLIQLPAKPTTPKAADNRTTVERYEAERKAAAAAQARDDAAHKKVAQLEKELLAIEQSYYEENDPAYRDDVIRKKFEAKRAELEAARVGQAPPPVH
jgi:hypothetical protein